MSSEIGILTISSSVLEYGRINQGNAHYVLLKWLLFSYMILIV